MIIVEGKFIRHSKGAEAVKIILPHHIYITMTEKVYDAAFNWCQNNNSDDFYSCWYSASRISSFYFKSKNDALIFKLTWAGATIKDIEYD
jgi:hypothetical protein